MASTNEDAVALATARIDDRRLLMMRHLPDRGTVEIGWWIRDEAGSPAQAQVLELAAEAAEVSAFAQMCRQLLPATWDARGEGEAIVTAGPFVDDAELVALRSGDEVTLVRHPEPGNMIRMSREALGLLVDKLPEAMDKLSGLGFGLPQQEEQTRRP